MSQRLNWMLVLVAAQTCWPLALSAQSPSAGAPIIGSPFAGPPQPAPVAEPVPPPPQAIPEPVVVQQDPVVDPAMQPLPPVTPFVPFNRPRVRYGFTLLGGPSVPSGNGGTAGGFGGASARLGVQINRMWGVYYQAQAVIGGYGYVTPGATVTDVFIAAYNTFAGSATLFDRLDFGFGPSIDAVESISASVNNSSGASAAVNVFAGTAFGLHARAAVILGKLHPERPGRSGFSLSLDVHPTFIDGRVLLTTAIGLGGDWY